MFLQRRKINFLVHDLKVEYNVYAFDLLIKKEVL